MKKLFVLFFVFASGYVFSQTSYYIKSPDGTELYVQEFGRGKPVVLVAGGPGMDAVYMEPIWTQLSSNYRCIVLDQRGTGKSRLAAVDSPAVTAGKYVDDVEALRKHLKLSRLTLVGHSWGGMLSMDYAAMHPGRVEKLILLNSGGPTRKFMRYFADNISMRLHAEDTQYVWAGYFFDRQIGYAAKNSLAPEKLFAKEMDKIFTYATESYFAEEEQRSKSLKRYKGVVYLIQGRQDPIGESTAYEIKSLLPQTQMHFIEKCGHFPWLENDLQRKEFFELLQRCLH